ncbi:ABC transporter substrate-binding protein [Paenibacillus nasutitermitis]|uniref:ABC transporter substrate-binding protein n=1 Tax=Paenibacillus nasutitermitis TaxID=1652958 RepID=A0A916Z6B5_9BACL|nr:ABC transporter substrate-binding protein [Paenibacillus nasutitermitis]GGD78667.1 ABC transporter substrate-binding protein [Paenibacillus nasutitermitis]
MKSKGKKSTGLLLALVLLVSMLAACSQNNEKKGTEKANTTNGNTQSEAGASAPDPVELNFMLWGDKPAGMDEVLAEFEKRTKDTLNMKINISWTPLSDFSNKVKLKLSAGEEVDAVFDAPWATMINNINQELYQELDTYFLNDEYLGLKQAFGEQYVTNNKFNGKLYGIPFTQGYKEIYGYFIRKDLREKYGMNKISSLGELEQYFDHVLKNEKGVIPVADDGNALRWNYGLTDENDYFFAKSNIFTTTLAGGLSATCQLSEDRKACISLELPGDKETPFPGIPYNFVELSSNWKSKGYFEKDLLTQQNATSMFVGGKAASLAHGISQFSVLNDQIAKAVPGAQLEFFASSDSQRSLQPAAMKTDFKAFNFISIPVTSKKADSVMKFFNWLFSDKANHDLFERGIEGVDWVADGDSLYKNPESGPRYVFPGYEMTWNPNLIRNLAGMDEQVYNILDYSMDVDSYYQTPLAGFTFNSEPVKSEIAKVTPVMDQIGQVYASGAVKDAYANAHELNKKAVKLGLEKIREEALKQINAYLAGK